MEEFPCDFRNAVNDKNFFLVLKAFPSQIQIYFLDFFPKKAFPNAQNGAAQSFSMTCYI